MTERQLGKWLIPEAEAERLKARRPEGKRCPDGLPPLVLSPACEQMGTCSSRQFVVDDGRVSALSLIGFIARLTSRTLVISRARRPD